MGPCHYKGMGRASIVYTDGDDTNTISIFILCTYEYV